MIGCITTLAKWRCLAFALAVAAFCACIFCPLSGATGTVLEIELVYFVPQDREPVEQYKEKIQRIAELMESVVCNDLSDKAYRPEGPRFRRDGGGHVIVDVINGEKTAAFYSQNFAWKAIEHGVAIFDEVHRRRGPIERRMTFVFCETYGAGPSAKLWPGHIALAQPAPPRGGTCVFSSWILRDEFASPNAKLLRRRFFDPTPVDGRSALGSRGWTSSVSDFMEDGVGGAVHELSHLCGLMHHSSDDVDRRIMAQGFRNLRWNVNGVKEPLLGATYSRENAGIMMTSRYINPRVDHSDSIQPLTTISFNPDFSGNRLLLTGHDESGLARAMVIQNIPVRGAELLWSESLDGTKFSRVLEIETVQPEYLQGSASIQLIAIDKGGNFGYSNLLHVSR